MSVDCVRALVQALSSGDPLQKTIASSALKHMAFEDAFDTLLSADAIPAIVSALRAGTTSPITQNAADAVWSLSVNAACRDALIKAGVVTLLSQLLFAHNNLALVHSTTATLCNMVDMETGMPLEVGVELLDSGGVDGLIALLPQNGDGAKAVDAERAAAQVLAAIVVNPAVGEEVCRAPQSLPSLVNMLKAGARSDLASHAAAILARMARNHPTNQAAIREAGGIEPLIDLVKDAVEAGEWANAQECQAAQHSAAALWILAAEPQSCAEILANKDALRALSSLVGGRFGAKAEGNAAGALLMLGVPRVGIRDPASVLTPTIEDNRVV